MILIDLFLTFFKIGILTFGGGYAMIPMIKVDTISKGWIDLNTLIDFIAVSESTPGPFAVNIATFIGENEGGILGALISTIGVILPSFLIILIIAKFFENFKDNKYVKASLYGLKCAVIGLIASAALSIAFSNLFPNINIGEILSHLDIFNWKALIVMAVIFALTAFKKKIHPILLIIISAVLGIVVFGGTSILGI